MVRNCCMADPSSLRRAAGWGGGWLGLLRLFSLLLGGLFGRRTQLRRHRLRQLHL